MASKLQAQMRERLAGGRFRYINELLYTQSGADSFRDFQGDPGMFDAYHAGFRAQVAGWPQNPLDVLLGEIRRAAAAPGAPATVTVADFGCGEARLAATLLGGAGAGAARNGGGKAPPPPPRFRVHSFDLVAPPGNALVTACNIASVPLPSGCADVAVFCLSLMGTNYMDFLREGARVLKPGGRLLIAEVRSRFEAAAPAHAPPQRSGGGGGGGGGSGGGKASAAAAQQAGRKRPRDEPPQHAAAGAAAAPGGGGRPDGVGAFVAALAALGFSLDARHDANTMFVTLFFMKAAAGSLGDAAQPGSATSSSGSSSSVGGSNTAAGLQASGAARGGAGGGGGKQHAKKQRHGGRPGDGAGGGSAGGPSRAHGPPAPAAAVAAAPVLKACIYKKR